MATGTIIQIKRTANIAAPTISDLAEAELAYSQDASTDGAGAILYIESVNANASPSIHKVGGKYYTDIVDGATANNTAGNLVKRSATGNFTANVITATLFGQANSATIATTANALTTARDIGLAGDLTGNVSFDGSGNVTLTATIAANSVALGTDTTGNYVGNVAAGTGLILVGDTYTVTNSGASAYSINGSSNPTLTLYRGFTYTFNVSASGHPFWIKTSQTTGTGNAYSSGVTNNGIDVGTITFVVPSDAPATLYYICQYHGSMVGTINVLTASENANITLGLGTSGVTAGTFGNATSIPAITVDQYGRVTSVSNTAISLNASSNVANSANALTNARDIGLAGDLTGNVSFDGSGNVTLTATIAANSVALGTDTTGYFVGNITAGSGISLSGAAGENANIIISNSGVTSVTGTADQITASASTGGITLSLPNDVTVNNNLTVQGNLFIKGTATTLQTATVSINDSLVKFGNANPGNSLDLGFFGEYTSGGNVNYSGLYRDHNDGKFRIFDSSTVNPTGNTISTSDSGYTIASLVANLTGGTVSGLTANITVGNGGTGRGTFTSNGILFGNTTGALKVTAAGTSGQVLKAGSDGTPEFGGIDGGTY